MATANVLTSLGAADLDTKQLVTDLVNAVKEPRQLQIDSSKKKAEVAVSSLAMLKNALTNLQTAATDLGSVGRTESPQHYQLELKRRGGRGRV